MNNNLSIRNTDSPTVPSLQQTGTNNVSVSNQPGATVNFTYNINFPQVTDSPAEMMIAVQSFSTEYYQLIVTCEEDVFSTGVVSVSSNRALIQNIVPPEIYERCSTLTEEGIAELKRFPAIICRENTAMKGITSPDQYCMLCYIQKVMKAGKNIKIAFKPIAPIQQIKLCDKRNAMFFGLNIDCAITDLNHSAWSVRKVNVFEAFREAGIPGIPMPI